jgi:ATP-binding cassette, subfamily B, multidrug efflux pump
MKRHAAARQYRRGLTWLVLSSNYPLKAGIIAIALLATLLGLVAPYCQKLFLDLLLGHSDWNAAIGVSVHGALILSISLSFAGMLMTQMALVGLRVTCAKAGVDFQRELSNEIYLHCLRLTGQARGSRTIGDLVTYYTQDIGAAVSLLEDFLPSLLSSVIPFIVAPLAVHLWLGLPLIEIYITLAAVGACLFLLSFRQSKFFAAFKSLGSERVALVNEWLQNIKIIRILGWTSVFEAKIFAKRQAESNTRLGMVTNGSTLNSIAQVAPLIVNVVGVCVLIRLHADTLKPGDIFVMLWIFGVFLTRPLRNLPWTLVVFLDGKSSCRRLEKFFRLPVEIQAREVPSEVSLVRSSQATGPAIVIEGLSLQLGDRGILNDIHFSAAAGEFVAIIGEVGSGKTQFLLSLLRDSPAIFDTYRMGDLDALRLSLPELRDLFSYVPQDGFIMSTTLRDNVAFAYDFPHDYDRDITESLRLADFDPQNERMTDHLETEIGERGVNLSGGQRQRVGLARAHLHQRSIVLLDDTFSAVDVETENKLIERLVLGDWKRHTRILVTHRLSILAHADKVYVMERGRLRLRP